MIIFQGEELTFEGCIVNDETGEALDDLSGKELSVLIKKDEENIVLWTTKEAVDDAQKIEIGSGGKVCFTLKSEDTAVMEPGAYVMECMLKDSDGKSISVCSEIIKVAFSNIGKIESL